MRVKCYLPTAQNIQGEDSLYKLCSQGKKSQVSSQRVLVAIFLFLYFKLFFSKRDFKTIARYQEAYEVRGEKFFLLKCVGRTAGLNIVKHLRQGFLEHFACRCERRSGPLVCTVLRSQGHTLGNAIFEACAVVGKAERPVNLSFVPLCYVTLGS